MNACAGCCDTVCTALATLRKFGDRSWQLLKLTRGSACSCVRSGHLKGEDVVATVLGDDITVGGERSAVEFLIRMTSKEYQNKKQGKN